MFLYVLALPDVYLLLAQAPPVVPSSTAAVPPEETGRASDAASDTSDDESYASSSEPFSEDMSSQLGSQAGAAARRLGSIASTYWRPERQDRKENLSVIDERYIALHVESKEKSTLPGVIQQILMTCACTSCAFSIDCTESCRCRACNDICVWTSRLNLTCGHGN